MQYLWVIRVIIIQRDHSKATQGFFMDHSRVIRAIRADL